MRPRRVQVFPVLDIAWLGVCPINLCHEARELIVLRLYRMLSGCTSSIIELEVAEKCLGLVRRTPRLD
jgi:hypothetical protein